MALLAAVVALDIGVASAANLQDTVRTAVSNHPKIGARKARANAAKERVRIERGKLFPSIDVSGSTGGQYYRTPSIRRAQSRSDSTLFRNEASVVINQLVFDGFSTINLVHQARALSRAAEFQVTNERHGIALTAVAAHLDVLRHRALVNLARQNIRNHQSTLSAVRELAAKANSTRADISQARSRLEAARARLEQRKGSLRDAEARYIETVGTKPRVLAIPKLPGRRTPPSLGEALKTASRNNPSVASARSQVRGERFGLNSTKGLFMPRVQLELSGRTADNVDGIQGNTTDLTALVVVRWNLYRGGADIARRREAKFRLHAAKNDEAEARRLVRERVRQAHAALVANQRRGEKIVRQVDASRRVVADYQEQFRLGQRNLLDLLDAQNEIFLAQEQLIDARYSILFNRYALLAAMGTILDHFSIAVRSSDRDRRISQNPSKTNDAKLTHPVTTKSELSEMLPKLRPSRHPESRAVHPSQSLEGMQSSTQ